MSNIGKFYTVVESVRQDIVRDYLSHGYSERSYFSAALRKLLDRWRKRTGECIGERNEFLLLRFHDTPGGLPDEEWIPTYILQESARPDYMDADKKDDFEREVDEAYGVD